MADFKGLAEEADGFRLAQQEMLARERLEHYDKRLDQAIAYSDIFTNVGNQVKAYQLTAITALSGLVVAMLIGIFAVLWQINGSQQDLSQRLTALELLGKEQNTNLDQVRLQNQSMESTIGSVDSEINTLTNTLGLTPNILRETANLVENKQREFSGLVDQLKSNVERINRAEAALSALGSKTDVFTDKIGAIEAKGVLLEKIDADISEIKTGISNIKK